MFLDLKLTCSPHHEAGLAAFNLRLTEIKQNFGSLYDLFYHLLPNLVKYGGKTD